MIEQDIFCPFCSLTEHKNVKLERRQNCTGLDYWYCPACETAVGQPFKNEGEVDKYCYDCYATTLHTVLGNCKVCGRKNDF
jgi:hypothetical protein